MRDEGEQVEVALARGEARRARDERGARAVLEASARARREVEEQLVGVVGERPAEERRLLLEDLARVRRRAGRACARGRRPRARWSSGAARRGRRSAPPGGCPSSMGESTSVSKSVRVERRRRPTSAATSPPASRRARRAPRGRRASRCPSTRQKERRADEERVGLVDVARPHRELVGVDAVAHDDAAPRRRSRRATRSCGSSSARAGASAVTPSTWRAYSRTRYEPGAPHGHEQHELAPAAPPRERRSPPRRRGSAAREWRARWTMESWEAAMDASVLITASRRQDAHVEVPGALSAVVARHDDPVLARS